MKNTLEVDSIFRIVNERLTLSDIYLYCETGNIIGIVGKNGSGKSLLMKIIFGTEKSTNKFIRINNILYKRPYQKSDLIAYLPQFSFLPKNLKVHKCIKLYITEEKAIAFLEDDLIQKIINNRVSELSGGELRYLEIKLILNTNVKFILLDEPLSYLSPKIKEKIMKMISEKSIEKGIIITDHDFQNLKSLVSKLYLMHNGSLKPIKNEDELIFWKYLPSKK